MPDDLTAVVAIALMAAVTLATRLGGAVVMRHIPNSARVERFLEAMASSVIAALVVTVVAQGGLREAVAVTLAGLVMLAAKNALAAMVVAMVAAAAWTALAGG